MLSQEIKNDVSFAIRLICECGENRSDILSKLCTRARFIAVDCLNKATDETLKLGFSAGSQGYRTKRAELAMRNASAAQ